MKSIVKIVKIDRKNLKAIIKINNVEKEVKLEKTNFAWFVEYAVKNSVIIKTLYGSKEHIADILINFRKDENENETNEYSIELFWSGKLGNDRSLNRNIIKNIKWKE